jgi:ribulose-phosphate 3-epimerase
MVAIAPSILAADFARLGEQVLETERAGAQRIHVDVMDGHFVGNLSMGPVVVRGLRPVTRLPLEVHLMVEEPARFADAFIKAGADSLIVHQEVLPDPRPLLAQIRSQGKRVGLAVNPETDIHVLEPFLAEIDLALCMTVHPGFGGQPFRPESPDRIRRLRERIDCLNPRCELEVDGGIDMQTAPVSVRAGANVLVAGTAIFHFPQGPTEAVRAMQALAAKTLSG